MICVFEKLIYSLYIHFFFAKLVASRFFSLCETSALIFLLIKLILFVELVVCCCFVRETYLDFFSWSLLHVVFSSWNMMHADFRSWNLLQVKHFFKKLNASWFMSSRNLIYFLLFFMKLVARLFSLREYCTLIFL